MKKVIALGLALGLSFSTLTGCNTANNSESTDDTTSQVEQQVENENTKTTSEDETSANDSETEYKDGTYTAEGDAFDEHGWKPIITVEVKDGKITSVDYDEVNEEGTSKETDEEYNTNMKEHSGIGPAEAFPQLEEELVEKQDVDAVDTVTGATSGSDNFKEMVKKALESAK